MPEKESDTLPTTDNLDIEITDLDQFPEAAPPPFRRIRLTTRQRTVASAYEQKLAEQMLTSLRATLA